MALFRKNLFLLFFQPSPSHLPVFLVWPGPDVRQQVKSVLDLLGGAGKLYRDDRQFSVGPNGSNSGGKIGRKGVKQHENNESDSG